MKRWPVRIAIVLTVSAVLGGESCDTETKDTADSSGDGESRKARLGDAITLQGFEGELKIKTKVTKVIDPLSAGEFDEPSAGTRLVGIQMVLANVGSKTYDDSPSNGAKILTTGDEQADPTILTGGPCAGSFASDTNIAPGARRAGCIPFEVRKGLRPKSFQFGLESGFGPQSGEWRLR